jgi:23S rRNA (cytidine1920-2'-O)/16S rRNA (cytidine1409-2'-O)-methyltransferase
LAKLKSSFKKNKIPLAQLVAQTYPELSTKEVQGYILSGRVLVEDYPVTSPAYQVHPAAQLRLKREKYVGRGGHKLEKALKKFEIKVADKNAIDIGCATGGFTDCLLQAGAKQVYAVDVGHNLLHQKIATHTRVIVKENYNCKNIVAQDFACKFDIAVIDVSFISILKILNPLQNILQADSAVIALVKPQFEVAKELVENGGLVTQKVKHQQLFADLLEQIKQQDYILAGLTYSPITGRKGNIEYLLYLKKQINKITCQSLNYQHVIDQAFNNLYHGKNE